jgi:phosphomannomutase
LPPLTLKMTGSGLRGVVGESLTPQLVTSFAAAFGNYCGVGQVLVGGEAGPGAAMLSQAAFAGLLSVGSAPVDLGLVPLPALMFAVRETQARGAICISGPAEAGRSALRFIGPDGSVLRANQAAELTDLYHQGVYTRVRAGEIGQVGHDAGAVGRHLAAVLAAVDVAAIAARRLRVSVEHPEGPAAPATAALLQALGCQVVGGGQAADVGFLQDADGDRVSVADERGQALAADATVAIAADHWLRRGPAPVVVSVSTSHMVEAAAARRGGTVTRTPVGENHVLDRMRELGAPVGGEGDGGVIVLPVNPCRDSFVAMALVLEALAIERAPLSERFAYLRAHVLLRDTLLCPAREVAPALRWLRQVYRGAALDLTDGVKVSWDDRWLHVRTSHRDPILRLTAEAPDLAGARKLLNEVLEHLSPRA